MSRFFKSLAIVILRLVLYIVVYISGVFVLILIFGIPPETAQGGTSGLGLFIISWPVFAYLLWIGLGMGKLQWWE